MTQTFSSKKEEKASNWVNFLSKQSQGSVLESRFSENSEFGNPEMRGTLGCPFQRGRHLEL